MEADALAHLERIEALLQGLGRIAWITAQELQGIRTDLLDFDARHWPVVRVLSLPLYEELTELLADPAAQALLERRPRLAVVMPVHAPQRDLLSQALASLRRQVGVAIEGLISVDGRREDLELVREVLAEQAAEAAGPGSGLHPAQSAPNCSWRLFLLERNRGVGPCRNRALREVRAPLFSCLDADDVFHPLRCLHALLLLWLHDVTRLNTGWCRVSLHQKKILLINDRLASVGHNSFIARTELLEQCGYQADLRFAEDTEFMQRHRFYGVSMLDSPVVSHYLHSEPKADYVSLATPCRREVHAIRDHPYLCGSVLAEAPAEWLAVLRGFEERYRSLDPAGLALTFPSDP